MYQQASGDFLQWLQTFLTVAETGNIHRAAVLCGLSPSAASLHIKKLEQDLDLKLFARQSKGMTLTQAGRQFKEASVPILESVGKLRKHKLKQPALSGSVRITCINHLALFFMPDVIEFCRLHPNVQLNFDTASPRRVVRNIEEGIFDLAAGIHEQLPGSLRFIPFRPSSAFLYTPPGNPFNLPAVPSWDEICSLPFIALTVEGYVNPVVATVPHIHQPTNIVVAVTDFLLAFQLVEFGVGACIAPPLGPWQPPEKYTLFNIDHIFPIGTLGLIVRQASYISPQAQAFIDFLTERYVERPG